MSKERTIRRTILPILILLSSAAAGPLHAQYLYWDAPRVVVPQGVGSSLSAAGTSLMALAWQEIKPRSATDKTSGEIWLSMAVSRDGISWKTHSRFFGPVRYTGVTAGNEPRVYSMAVDAQDRILIAVASSDRDTVLLQSVDEGATFRQVKKLSAGASAVVPNLFTASGGGFLLFVSLGTTNADTAPGSATLSFSRSEDGKTWTSLSPFITKADNLASPQLQPTHATFQGREIIVFESFTARSALASATGTWQLYAKTSADGGATWEPAAPITTQKDLFSGDPLAFDNERPSLSVLGTQLGLVWERTAYGSNKPKIWTARLSSAGGVEGAPEAVTVDSPTRFARGLLLRGAEYVLYADSSKGTSRVILSQKGKTWTAQSLLNTDVLNAVFPHALVFKNALYVFWENQLQTGGSSALVQLLPLTSVGAPVVKAVDFTPGQPSNRDSVSVSWTEPVPKDPSGIKEYRYAWTFSDGVAATEVERKTVSRPATEGAALVSTRKADRDGTWTFSVTALDFAGNVTKTPATVSFIRDATPPAAVSFTATGPDGSLLLSTPGAAPDTRDEQAHVIGANTFTLRWVPAGEMDIVGYTYNIQPGWATLEEYLSSSVPLVKPPERLVTTTTDIPFKNRDNGVYVVTVRAVDRAGNYGPPSTVALGLDKYQVVTRIDFVTAQKDPLLGTVKLTIVGRGFTQNGPLQKIYLDRRHAQPPWDIELDPRTPVSVTDRQITGIVLDQNNESGVYRVGLQQKRPSGELATYFAPGVTFEFLSPGTVKIGNFNLLLPTWVVGTSPQYFFSFESLLVVMIVALLCVFAVMAIRKIVALAQEGAVVQSEVLALLEGKPNAHWEERKKRMQALEKRHMGLRVKFTLLIVVLVFIVVLIVSIPLGFQMVNRQRTSLATSLRNKSSILLGALASSAETQFRLQDQGFIGAADIPNLRSTMPEAVYTTITGSDANFRPTDPKDYVWASDQKIFADQLKAARFKIAEQKVDDALAKEIPALQRKIDTDLKEKLSASVDRYRALKGQQKNLLTKTDAVSKQQLATVNEGLASVSKEIDADAKAIYGQATTLEEFRTNARLSPTYMFYQPVIYYNRAENIADTTFYQGMVRLEVKTDEINQQIDQAIRSILGTASGIALAAIMLGVLGAIIMANITVTPIRKLAKGVEHIRDTENKKFLKEFVIDVGTRDEIGMLADTVNEMTRSLAEAAIKNELLLMGKDVQKRFLPLEKDKQNRILATAESDSKDVEIYGFYEGAKEVSGDYFDFKKLDDTHYAFIKCDVSGKGVPAALVMVEVATMFISHFRDWEKRKGNITAIKDPKVRLRALQELERLDGLVLTINDMLEERGFKGMFAAFTICIFNSETGIMNVCNAGDTEMHIFKASEKKIVHVKIPPNPAAGSFPSMLVEMKGGFKQVPHRLDKGDALLLFTDGFEEAQRHFRNAAGEVVKCDEPSVKMEADHLGTHQRGQDVEQFTLGRICPVVESVFAKGTYTLVRNHLAEPNETLEFDFTGCAGSVKDAVLALVAVEKVFRLNPTPGAAESNRIKVDPKVADFLKGHFKQYDAYFSHRLEDNPDDMHVGYSHLREDDQYDDLTIIVLRRK